MRKRRIIRSRRTSRSRRASRSKTKGKMKSYYTNFLPKPLFVQIYKHHIEVFQVTIPKGLDVVDVEKDGIHQHVLSIPRYSDIFIGYSPRNFNKISKKKFIGNTVLVHLQNNEYLLISYRVIKFRTVDGELITKFLSPFEDNGVFYPYAISSTYVYDFTFNKVVPKSLLKGVSFLNPNVLDYNDKNIPGVMDLKYEIIVPGTYRVYNLLGLWRF